MDPEVAWEVVVDDGPVLGLVVEDVVDEVGVLELLGEDVRLCLEDSEAELDGVSNVEKSTGLTALEVPGVKWSHQAIKAIL